MIDFLLKFLDENEATTVFNQAGMTYETEDSEVKILCFSHQWAIDLIGEIEGYIGWHANLRLIDTEIDTSMFDPYLVYPVSPKVVWA